MSIWTDMGFRESPYATDPIPATSEGDRLLVGREPELKRLMRQLTSSGLHPTIEGDNGVGKTSLVSVAGYRLMEGYRDGSSQEALIPLARSFQLTTTDNADTLTRKVLYDVADAFVANHDFLRTRGLNVPETDAINRWLNAPLIKSGGITASILGSGGGATAATATNTSDGFSESGFAAAISRWLRECFPSRQAGGFICVIDNLELLETSQAARLLLESMRDTVLSQAGLRWVLCGARGIVRTGASSARLEGRLSEPMEVMPISDHDVAEVIARRIEIYGIQPETVAPVGRDGFRHLYDVLNRNLRNTLKFCEDFSFWLHDAGEANGDAAHYSGLLQVWLTEQADRYNTQTALGKRAWILFDQMATLGGNVSPSDFATYGFNSLPAMRPHVKALEDANLVQSTVDDTDKRRKTIVMTPRGWLVRYARIGYETTSA